MNFPHRISVATLFAGAALFGAATAHADSHVNWALSVGVPIAPVYVAPQPVYVEPAPVYVAPMVVRPAPVVRVQNYYAPPAVVVEEDVRYGYRGHDSGYWKHHHPHHGGEHGDHGHGRGHEHGR
jgi:hypothetical protein